MIVDMTGENEAIRNDVIRGDLMGVKVADGSLNRLANVPFRLTLNATGESHVLMTDENGQFSTASSWNPHSQNTNRGESPLDGVWFGDMDALDDSKGALPRMTRSFSLRPSVSLRSIFNLCKLSLSSALTRTHLS